MQSYLENPQYAEMYRYAMGPPNGGYYRRWIQGSVGMMDGLPLYSNEYSHLYMKHGQNGVMAYRGNVKPFAPSVTASLYNQVERCSMDTINPVGCQDAAIKQAFTTDTSSQYQRMEASHHPHFQHIPLESPHPFGTSYHNGVVLGMPIIPPNVHYQD